MGIIAEYLLGRLGYVRHQPPPSTKPTRRTLAARQRNIIHSRSFDAAQGGRLLGSWNLANESMDDELRTQLPTLRARSRDVCMNNSYGIQFLRKVRQNVVGPHGIRYQARTRQADGSTLDNEDNKRLEEAYKISGQIGNYDVTGKLSRADGQRAMIESAARDGEILARFVRGYDNEVGFAIELMNPDRLDWSYNIERNTNGNRVVMGVELDGWGRPIGYYILTGRGFRGGLREWVPARDILHAFVPFRIEANRGVPWMHAALVELKHLGGYKEAAVVAARVGANQLGWIKGGDARPLDGEEDANGDTVMPSGPGEFGQLPEDAELVNWNPEYPHQQFEAFNKAMLKGISSGFGVSYPTFSNDLEGTNFSSMRGGVLDERDSWMVLQDWFINAVCRREHREWLSYQLIAKRIPAIAPLPQAKFAKFLAAEFQARRWQWVDPLKDEQANDVGVKRRTRSRSSIIRDMGLDPEEVWDEIAREEELMRSKGLDPKLAPEPKPPGAAGEEGEEDDDADDGATDNEDE